MSRMFASTLAKSAVRKPVWPALAVALACAASALSPTEARADTTVTTTVTYSDTDPSALSDFHDPLAPYGTWVVDANYGTVWVPSTVVVGSNFAPYSTAGHWALDENDEWMWVSDYDWGYIPFHYGRWVWISSRGWAWIPGRVYAPAWVVWRTSDYGYVGWAPAPPAYYWSSGVAVGIWYTPRPAYIFCPTTYVFHSNVNTYIVRDASTVRSVAYYSRPYKAATPTAVGPSSGSSASKNKMGTGSYKRSSPSLAEAKIPKAAAPKARVQPDTRARQWATKAGSEKARLTAASARSAGGGAISGATKGATSTAGAAKGALPNGRPSAITPATKGQPVSRPAPSSPGAPRTPNVTPSTRPPKIAPATRTPSVSTPPARRPSVSTPPARAPSVSVPPARAPSVSAPRPSVRRNSTSSPPRSSPRPSTRPSMRRGR